MTEKASQFIFPVKPGAHAEPPTDEVDVQFVPSFMSTVPGEHCSTLQIGGAATLDHRVEQILFNYDWSFQAETAFFDVDAAVALFNKDAAVVDFVWWDNKKTRNKSVEFGSSDDTGSESTGSRERIRVKLDQVQDAVQYLVTTISVYSKDHELADLEKITVGVDTPNGNRIIRYEVEAGRKGRSLLLGCLVRGDDGWTFRALKQEMDSRTILEIMHEPVNLEQIWKIPSAPRLRRHLVLQPLEGKDLTPMDFTLFTKRSDPYLKIFYEDQMIQSEVSYKTLNPKFVCQALDLGEVGKNSTKVVEIQCWDWDKFSKDDIMGVHKFCLGGLMPQLRAGENKVWFKLFPTEENIKEEKQITGDVLCNVLVEERVMS